MTVPPKNQGEEPHSFGGQWTTEKLRVVGQYLERYTTALKKQPFRKWYIDAFAGTGTRQPRRKRSPDDLATPLLFSEEDDPAVDELLDGSARIALKTDPPFDRYVFIEKSAARCKSLDSLKLKFPQLASRIDVVQEEANSALQRLGNWDSRGNRAVLFLDPYGMEVEWKTIEAIAATRAIDLWVLIPLGIGPVRLLSKTGEIPETWAACLDRFLGTGDWRRDLYKVNVQHNLFGDEVVSRSRERIEVIERYINDRLKCLFAAVAEPPGYLRNSTNTPLYLLKFAAANPNGAKVAIPIANHLLKGLR